jgi:O-antigen/teichoic acid export membrane protein
LSLEKETCIEPLDRASVRLAGVRLNGMHWYRRFRQRLTNNPRFSRVLHGSFSGMLGRGLTLLINIITLPLTLRYLGRFEYGIWVTVSTSVVMFSVLDLGIANTLNNFIAEAYAEGDREKAQRYFATAFWITIAIVAALLPVAYLGSCLPRYKSRHAA